MKRRTLLKSVAAALVARPARGLALDSQATNFTVENINTLRAIAEVVLPDEIGRDARQQVVMAFATWLTNYKQGADMGHGYGSSTLRSTAGPSPFARYPAQFAALDAAARTQGAATFRDLPRADQRVVIEKFLNEPQPVNRLPAQPTGANLIADFMGSYFTSPAAWDVCYRAEIGRDTCRTLDNSAEAPRPIR